MKLSLFVPSKFKCIILRQIFLTYSPIIYSGDQGEKGTQGENGRDGSNGDPGTPAGSPACSGQPVMRSQPLNSIRYSTLSCYSRVQLISNYVSIVTGTVS